MSRRRIKQLEAAARVGLLALAGSGWRAEGARQGGRGRLAAQERHADERLHMPHVNRIDTRHLTDARSIRIPASRKGSRKNV